ncbi:uncharacterized protein BX663DRAFT_567544 [Cokeromyces recurvatus]|uniref:uncharacterized protein n=1 Tax=Cokeromyces recurvatus TaxID=90255 RepID=UPI00221E74C9|nr:uncharacterized protein BX663DRAFT_567544 [Cokeromyces recurvatus]KAI7903507.1 hypothetical protein BX663DRAFT_567544 [Cokeromyces recurvatus]
MVKLTLTTIVFATLFTLGLGAEDKVCEKSIKVNTQSDLDAIKSCKIFKGAINIDQLAVANLRLDGVQQIIGDLILTGNADLLSFSAPDLQKVDGHIKVENHTILSKAEFPKLTEAKSFSMAVLPALEVIHFPSGLSKIVSMRIEDTRAPRVEGFKPETLDTFILTNNVYLKSFDFNSVKEVKGDILVLGNNRAMTFEANQLKTINTATFLNLAAISLPALSTIKSDISFHENDFMTLNLDSVETIGGTVTIANNNKLGETSFKNLTRINGALSVGNNTQLTSIDGFPLLSEVYGTIDLAGSFNKYDLPSLQDVRGGMRLQSTSSQLGCPEIERKLKGDNIVKGSKWSCTSDMKEANMIPTVGQKPSSKSGNDGGNTQSDANPLINNQRTLWLACIFGLIYYLG